MIVLPSRNELWVGDGDGTVKIIDLFNSTIIASINTTSTKRADEFAYDPANNIVVVTNPNENPPYVSVISATKRTVLGRILFPNVTELEQPAFNPADGLFYVSVPSSGAHPGGSICTLNIADLSIAHTYPIPDCVPAGIVFGPKNHLFIGCSESQITDYGYAASYIMDVSTGSIISNISGLAGIDQVAYDSTANLFYASAYQNLASRGKSMPQIAVVNASSGVLVQTLVTDNVTAHAVAVDGKKGLMIVPIQSQGIVVYDLKAGVQGSGNLPASATATGAKPSASVKTSGGAVISAVQVLMTAVVVSIAGSLLL
jgi:DNA-binding beta-propeller fold protein YncE